jgi:hypothetical protein
MQDHEQTPLEAPKQLTIASTAPDRKDGWELLDAGANLMTQLLARRYELVSVVERSPGGGPCKALYPEVELRTEVEALKARLADAESGISKKAREAAELLAAGMKADRVALKMGYKEANARSSLYTMLRRNGIDPKELRKGVKPQSGQA